MESRKQKKKHGKKLGKKLSSQSQRTWKAENTNLRKCILVQLGPTISPNSDDNTLVCETFSFQRNVHHTPFCSAPLPSIQWWCIYRFTRSNDCEIEIGIRWEGGAWFGQGRGAYEKGALDKARDERWSVRKSSLYEKFSSLVEFRWFRASTVSREMKDLTFLRGSVIASTLFPSQPRFWPAFGDSHLT